MKRDAIVAAVNRKGGSGKTTTTLNLAGALADQGYRVLLVDLDPQASLTRLLSDEPAPQGIGACIMMPTQPAAALIRPALARIDLIPGDRSIEAAALSLADAPTGFLRLRRALTPIEGYDVLLLDTPPALGFALSSAIQAAGWAILPTATTQQDFDALRDTLTTMDEFKRDDLPCADPLAILPNLIHRDGVDHAGIDALRTRFGDLVADPIAYTVAIKRASNARLPVTQAEPDAIVVPAYRALAARVAAAAGLSAPQQEQGEAAYAPA